MVALPFVMLGDFPFSYFDATWPWILRPSVWLIVLATAMSVISGVIYVIQNRHVLASKEK